MSGKALRAYNHGVARASHLAVAAEPPAFQIFQTSQGEVANLGGMLANARSRENFRSEVQNSVREALRQIAHSYAGSQASRAKPRHMAEDELERRLRKDCRHWLDELKALGRQAHPDDEEIARADKFVAVLCSAWSAGQLKLVIPFYQKAMEAVEMESPALAREAVASHPRLHLPKAIKEEENHLFVDLDRYLAKSALTADSLEIFLKASKEDMDARRRHSVVVQVSTMRRARLVELLEEVYGQPCLGRNDCWELRNGEGYPPSLSMQVR